MVGGEIQVWRSTSDNVLFVAFYRYSNYSELKSPVSGRDNVRYIDYDVEGLQFDEVTLYNELKACRSPNIYPEIQAFCSTYGKCG